MSGIIGGSPDMRSGIVGEVPPRFFAQLTTNQTITASTHTTLVCNNDSTAGWTYDSNNWYDTSTGKFTPKYAGYYYFSANIGWTQDLTADVTHKVSLSKNWNGSGYNGVFRSCGFFQVMTNGGNTQQIIGQTFCNGSTDWVQVLVYHANSTNRYIDGDDAPHHEACNFSGFMIR
tara:strand:- start:41 stop:562 length:522 start_codon:yes stop_codon:yes gene_type:complete